MSSTFKVAGSIEREVRAFSAEVDTFASHLQKARPEAGLVVHRGQDRMVLQAGEVGLTMSLFRSRAGAEAGAELVVALWQGEITLPGSTPRSGRKATQLSARQFHIAPEAETETSWVWVDEAKDDLLTSRALAEACVDTLAAQLP